MYFRNEQHQKHFEKKVKADLKPNTIAVIYLLSADYKL